MQCEFCGKKISMFGVDYRLHGKVACGSCFRQAETLPKPETNEDSSHDFPAAPASSTVEDTPSSRLLRRYKDGYAVAKNIIAYGQGIKNAGIFLGLILTFLVFTVSATVGKAGVLIGCFFSILAGIGLYQTGVIIAAQGQLLLASFDTAVNTSPFLENDQRIEAMSL